MVCLALDASRILASGILALWVLFATSAQALAAEPDDPRVTPVVKAYQLARPAVVNISAERVVTAGPGIFGGDPFEDIFPSPLARRVPVQGLGSGVIVHPRGYIITNAHVVRRAEKVTVALENGEKRPAEIISADSKHDLAILRIDAPLGKGLPFLKLGRSDDLMVGETVIAIGNPLGYSNSVTTGVVSAVNRTLEFSDDVKYTGLIEINAPINPGNSGGPLLNIKGEFIGINSAIRADAQNIGFAIPVDALAEDFPKLLDFERINRVVFGASVAQRHGKEGDELHVTAVRAGTPAEKALKVGDRIVAVNDEPVRQIAEYTCAMMAARSGSPVRLTVARDGKERPEEVTPAAKPRPDGNALAWRHFGMKLKPLTPEMARDLGLAWDRGLLVTSIDAGGPADRLGVKVRDVLFQLDRYFVTDLDDLGLILEDLQPGQSVRIGVARGSVRAWSAITARKAAEAPETPKAPKAAEKRI